MSREIAKIKGVEKKDLLYLVQFYGGEKSGLCLQLTPNERGYVQFTKKQVQQLVRELQNWLGETELPWKSETKGAYDRFERDL